MLNIGVLKYFIDYVYYSTDAHDDCPLDKLLKIYQWQEDADKACVAQEESINELSTLKTPSPVHQRMYRPAIEVAEISERRSLQVERTNRLAVQMFARRQLFKNMDNGTN